MVVRSYPHLAGATAFPDVGGVKPYAQYANEFDYTRWTPGTKITVCDVPWDGERNIVDFGTDEARDAWFESVPGEKVSLQTELHLLPDGTLKLPLPFSVMSRFNYVWVEYPVPTSPDSPIAHASGKRTRCWGFFADSPRMLAPNTTEVRLRLDEWTTFGNHVSVTHCQLRRGHAPMAAVDADEYLADPISKSALLLAPDVNYGPDAGIVREHVFVPLGAGEKYVMFASVMSPDDIAAMGEAKPWDGDSTPPEYADTPDRWGHQWEVKGYDWRIGPTDFSGVSTPVSPFATDGNVPTGGFAYAVRASEASGLFRAVVAKTPQFMQSIRGVWVVPAEFLNLEGTSTVRLAGVDVLRCAAVNELPDVEVHLRKEDFGYPEGYGDIAKLYTFPYACLNLSDNDGTSVDIRIENTGDLRLHRRVALAYPYLKAQAFLTGVNGSGAKTYEWRDLSGASHEEKSWDTQFADFMAEFDIPTYGLFMDGYTDWALHNQQTNLEAARLKALKDYRTGQRSNNTGYENTLDSNTAAYANAVASADTGLGNANRSADTGYTNAVASADVALANGNRSADMGYDNAAASAETAYQNGKRAAETAKTNADSTANTALENANAAASTARGNANAAASTARANAKASNATAQANAYRSADTAKGNVTNSNDTAKKLTALRNATSTQLTGIGYSQAYEIASDTSNSWNLVKAEWTNSMMAANQSLEKEAAATSQVADSVAGIASGMAQGGVAGAASAFASGALSTVTMGIAMAKQDAVIKNQQAMNKAMAAGGTAYSTALAGVQKSYADKTTKANNQLNTDTTNENTALADMNSTNDQRTAKANADASLGTGNANADRSYATETGNAGRTYATTTGNAARSNRTALAVNRLNLEVQLGGTSEADGGNLGRVRATSLGNATRTRDVAKGNNQAARDTAVSNAGRGRDTAKGNAKTSRDTAVSNAGRSKDVGNANALESRESSEYTLKSNLEIAPELAALAYGQQRNAEPKSYGAFGGDPTPDVFRYRGVEVRVRTQSESAIRQAGDQFLRYGYAYNGAWEVDSLNVMPRFTYWEMSEVWLDADTDIMESARRGIRAMLENGVTVWRRPEDIGKVGIHGNR